MIAGASLWFVYGWYSNRFNKYGRVLGVEEAKIYKKITCKKV
jgi:hypothetical protein